MFSLSFIFAECRLINRFQRCRLRRKARNVIEKLEQLINPDLAEVEQSRSKRRKENDPCSKVDASEVSFDESEEMTNCENLVTLVNSGENIVQKLNRVGYFLMEIDFFFFFSGVIFIYDSVLNLVYPFFILSVNRHSTTV
jgi:hypothetical protein